MACGCKKKKIQDVKPNTVQITVTETKQDNPAVPLTPEQQKQVAVIVDKINKLTNN